MTALLNADPPMIVRHIRGGAFTRTNSTFVEQMGFAQDELSASPLLDYIHPSDHGRFQRVLNAGKGTVRAHHVTKTGDWVEFDWELKPHADGLVALGLKRDRPVIGDRSVGSRKTAVPETMSATLEAMVLIVEAERPGMKCSVLLLNEAGTQVSVGGGPSLPQAYNEAVEGLTIGPFVGSCGTASYWKQPVIVTNIQTDPLWAGLKEHAKSAGVVSCWSHPVTAHDGTILGAAALYSPAERAPTQGELNGLTTLARMFGLAIERCYADEELKKSQAARLARESELEDQLHQAAKMEALGVLAGGLAHDFNNVLATVMANAEQATLMPGVKGDLLEMLQDIQAATHTASDLCEQLLAIAGQGAISKQRIECNGMFLELTGLLSVGMSKKVTLEYDLCTVPLHVEADRAQMGQVILNLITNAAEALENNPGKIRVRSGLRDYQAHDLARFQLGTGMTPGMYVWFTVSDSGCGMSKETKSKIFDPFFSTKFTGRGLGLSAVRGIIHRHGGGIVIDSALGIGTTFTVLFPQTTAPEVVSTPVTVIPAKPHQDRCVLLVDDDPLLMKALTRAFHDNGFEVLQAENGREAMARYRQMADSIDCVLLDLNMPEFDGEETFLGLREIRSDVRVVIYSGCAEREIVRRVGEGVAGVLRKPTSVTDMVAKVVEVCEQDIEPQLA